MLAEYRERHGHCLVKRQESVPLAKWTTRQREHYRAGALSAVRVQKLEALGFSWNPERAQFAGAWEERYAQLVAFHRQHGHTRVSKAWKKNPGLGHWRHFQRILQREGKMDAGRRERLDALGFEWEEAHVNWQSRIPQWEQLWELRFRELRAFKKRFGHCLVVTGWRENPALAKWVQKQRGKYRTGLLRTDQIQRLEALDFAWASDYAHFDKGWEGRFEELTAFHRRFGHTRVPAKWKENPPLAAWKFQQRKRHRAGQLSAERKARLDALGFEWME